MSQYKPRFNISLLVWGLCALILSGCQALNPIQNRATLYDGLGGRDGIEQIANGLIYRIGQDDTVVHYFKDSNLLRFRDQFVDHLCELADGPCEYSGDTMVQVHQGMRINKADFNRIVELLIDAMNERDVPLSAQNRLLAKLAPLRGEIIHH